MNFLEVRKKFPQYNDMSDQQLADALHAKYYPDLDKAAFYKEVGISEKPTAPMANQPTNPQQERKPLSQHLTSIAQNAPDDLGNIIGGAVSAAVHPVDTLSTIGGAIGNAVYDFTHQSPEDIAKLKANLQARAKDPQIMLNESKQFANKFDSYVEKNPVSTAMMIGPLPASTKLLQQDARAGGIASELLGMSTGAGPGAIDEALKGSQLFRKAMRGNISGREVVDTARSALRNIKINRANQYRQDLAKVSPNKAIIDFNPVATTLDQEIVKYFRVDKNGDILWDRPAVNQAAAKDIKEIYDYVNQWGTRPGDFSAMGMDGLKRWLDNFYSESSQARAFVTKMEDSVRKSIVSSVPEYADLTSNYAKATNLIKDIESNLMLKKQGMSGRITADQTLRRLTSSLREGFEMRRDLLETLGREGGVDVSGAVAGHAMSPKIPRGLVGKLGGGGIAYITYLHPKLWPILAASSPRVVGEFLQAYGRALKYTGPALPSRIAVTPNVTQQILGGSEE